MGTTLTGTTPQDTYDSLIKVTDNGPLSGTAKYLSDGLGNDSALAVSTTAVGVGTAAPARKLEVMDSLRVTTAGTNRYFDVTEGTIKLYSSNAEPSIKFADYNTGLDRVATIGYEGNFFGRGAISFVVKEQGSGTAAEAMRLTAAGNVGIGTSSPTSMLTLNGTTPYIRIERSGVPTWQIQNNTLVTDAGFSINNATNVATPFFINGTTNQVGILNANPLQPLDVTGNIRTSTGILFGSDTAAANLLDDYEEGTWTMGVSFGGASVGVTYSTNTGTYTKIGRQVTVNGLLSLTSKGSSTGDARITGLPFTIGGVNGNYSTAGIYAVNISFANQLQAFGSAATQLITLAEITEAGVTSNLTNADFANNSEIMVSLTYFV